MNQQIPLKNIIVITSGILLALFICFLLYIQLIKPISLEVQTAELELNTEKQLLEMIEAKENITSEEQSENVVNLQTKIPIEPMVDQFLLTLEKSEKDAKVSLKEISLNDMEQTPEQESNENSEDTNVEDPIVQPEGLKKINVHMIIEAENFHSIKNFLIDIEKMPRTTYIERVQFESPTTKDEKINFSIDLILYYLPGLIDIVDWESIQNLPEPANKKTPF
ncbi:hypothetical protein [Pseudogracilibacillus auburnensis]|uniref:hypothetical protein n=1 Tax=Pseudogracilibacillus auburnensis TaxID=1494959 RepID=UPI001A97597D|nr:hypothetical protein [Pseudogracilibacillus auburnensis]MBO1005600.1 hypothetical protein [Pseudogracilibacillus auburnensis]